VNDVPGELQAWCDADRMVQVLVNLLRNGVDALSGASVNGGKIRQKRLTVSGMRMTRESGEGEQTSEPWCAITITDNGPGIDARVLPTLFEPFASTRLDSTGTGLGLAVAEGIVREHGGVIIARNRTEPVGETGAVFEVVLPVGVGKEGVVSGQ
jgi:signal transduction histidine kinase